MTVIVLWLWIMKPLTTAPAGSCCCAREVWIFGIDASNFLILYSTLARFFLLSSSASPTSLTIGTMGVCLISLILRAELGGWVGAGGRIACRGGWLAAPVSPLVLPPAPSSLPP